MIAVYYQNKKIKEKKIFSIKSLTKKIKEKKDLTKKPTKQKVKVNFANYTINVNNKEYACAISKKNTKKGEFIVMEKWKYPYWKSKTQIYSPGKDNPIGKYLIILYNPKTKKKINQSIHTWPKKPFVKTNFKQGDFGEGCIRINKKDMKKIFKKIKLGTKIIIK